MTTYQPVPTGTTGDSISADYWNTYVRDNFATLFPYAAKGDLAYLSAADVLSKISKPSAVSALTMTGMGVPAWVIPANLSGHLNTKGTVDFAPGQTINGSWTDITGASVAITTTATCTIMVLATVTGYCNKTSPITDYFRYRVSVGTTPDTGYGNNFNLQESVQRNESLPNIYFITGVAAGAITVKLQGEGGGGDSNIYTKGRLIALAFTE